MNVVISLLYFLITIYVWLIVARALLSWFPLRPGTFVARAYGVLYDITEPYLGVFRRLLPPARIGGMGIDLSAILAIVVLFVVLQVLVRL